MVAVSTIVSEQRNVWRSMIVGALWGAGHTFSLVLVGLLGGFRVAVPTGVANWLEFGVALMIITLGAMALRRATWKRTTLHVHVHRHLHRHTPQGQPHLHVHFHESDTAHKHEPPAREPETSHSHTVSQAGFKPLLVGAMHGLAGSAALTLLILTQIPSVLLGLLLSGLVRDWIDDRHAADVGFDRTTVRVKCGTALASSLRTTNHRRRSEYRLRIRYAYISLP